MSLPQRLARVLPVTLAGCLALWAASLDNDDYCGTVGECLGTAFDDLLVLAVAVLLGPALLWACRLPRVLGHTAALLLVGGSLWYAGLELTAALLGSGPFDDTPMPLAAVLVVGTVTALAASYAAGPGGRPLPRVLVLAGAPGLAVVTHLAIEAALA